MRAEKILYMNVDELIPYSNNPRNNDKAVSPVAESIRAFGFKQPIVIDKNNVIIAGHTRLRAAKELGLDKVPVILADDLNTEQVQALRLADNKTAELADWDMDLLNKEFFKIQDIDMDALGFQDMGGILEPPVEEDTEDEVIPVSDPVSKPGDIFELDSHRLMCGDSTNVKAVSTLMGGVLSDLVVTDPPYNVDYTGGTDDALKIQNDNMDDAAFSKFLSSAFVAMKENLKPGGVFYIWHPSSGAFEFMQALRSAQLDFRQTIIWVKNSFALSRQDYNWRHEPCLYGWKDGAAHYFTQNRTNQTVYEDAPRLSGMTKQELIEYVGTLTDRIDYQTDVVHVNKPVRNGDHPTMKPVKLLAEQIKNSSRKGEKVLDLFGGSGSTLMACEQLGRSAYLMELDPRYVDATIARWEKFTGKKAVLLKEGQCLKK